MSFKSILNIYPEKFQESIVINEPNFFSDLNIEQVVNAITKDKEQYNLKSFYYTSLCDIEAIKYRQEVMKELENEDLVKHLINFAERMITVRKQLEQVDRLYYKFHKERIFLDIINLYCDSILQLSNNLSKINFKSVGFIYFNEYLTNYIQSEYFINLQTETQNIIKNLHSIKYTVHINNLKVRVKRFNNEPFYNDEVKKTFEKFKQGKPKNYKVGFAHPFDMNHVEAQILEGVAYLFPEPFNQLDNFYSTNQNFIDETIKIFDREIQFFIAYNEFISIFRKAGLPFCYPEITKEKNDIYCNNGFDLALAYKLTTKTSSIVLNDFSLNKSERVIVVTGPNQGGKTTFARMFGQLHFFASLGCPVPGTAAKLFLFDNLFTHFEKEENIKNLRGKLEDDLIRIHKMLEQATNRSIIILNEIFTSTTLADAIYLSKNILDKILQLDLLSVWVTFIDELSNYNEKTVSMVSLVLPENQSIRTYKLVRKPADGLARALSIIEKYHLSYNQIKERIK